MISGQIILLPASTLLFRRDCLAKSGLFNEDFITGEYDFIARLVYQFNGARCQLPPVHIRRHSDNNSKIWEVENYQEVLHTTDQFYTAGMISKSLFKERSLEFHYKLGFKFWEQKKYLTAVKEFINCYMLKPVHLKTVIKNINQLLKFSE